MISKPVVKRVFVILSLLISISTAVYPWQHHPIFTKLVTETLPEVKDASPVPAEPLEQFLIAEGQKISQVLTNVENWAKQNITMYAPCPPDLLFSPTGDATEIRTRFFKAIRVNPNIKTPLYYVGFASNPPEGKSLFDVKDVCILNNTKEFEVFCFVKLNNGDTVSPVYIVASAANEPDYGMDTGLFSDNQTEFGAIYGFGVQPFGNPNLGSQAPFHMGFYHENPIITFFAPFLKQSYVEYRIYLYKELSKLAFETGHDYWGWRFMGWGLHYLGDLSMPYHTTALPGYSALRMLWIYLLDILGWSTPKNNAVQLSSNRHLAIETLMGILYVNAVRDVEDPFLLLEIYNNKNYINNDFSKLCSRCPLYEGQIPQYSDDLPRKCLALRSHNWSRQLDRLISKVLPDRFVNDPSVELNNLPERENILSLTLAEQNFEEVRELVDMANASLFLFNYYGKSYILDIVK